MHALFQDVRHAWRSLMQTPGFAAVSIMTLALGIGAATAIFTVVNAVLLQPLRFADPQQLTMIWTSIHSRVPPAYINEWRARSQTMNDVAGWRDDRVNLTGRGEPSELLADLVTSNFFAVLGVPASLGRTFTAASTLNVVGSEVVLSHRFWQRRYGGDTAVIGQSLTLDGRSFTIIGVMPERFAIRTLELAESRPDVWLPLALLPADADAMSGILHVVGRLKAGVTVERAQAELTLIARNVEGRQPSSTRDWSIEAVPLLEATVRDVRLTMLVLTGAVIILLLIACANVGNLLLSRGAARRQELAIRQSLGATAGRLVRQLLTESFLLATVGGVLGFVMAMIQTKLLISTLPASLDFPRIGEVTVDARMLVFALSVTSLSAILFGLVPAWMSAWSASPLAAAGTARGSSFSGPHVRFSAALIVMEIALAVTVLAGAGLLVRSFWNLTRVNPGFDASHVTTMRTALPASKYDTDERVRLFGRDLLRRIESLPGVDAAGVANYLPLSRVGAGGSFEIEGRAADRANDRPGSWISVVGGNYFEAMGIPLLRGRVPTDADTEITQPVFVIDEGLAQRYWPGEDPVGARVTWQWMKTGRSQVRSSVSLGASGGERSRPVPRPPRICGFRNDLSDSSGLSRARRAILPLSHR